MESFSKKFQCEADFAENGSEALAMIKKKKYSVVFMDIKMPVMDGKEAMRRLKESNYKQPVISLTGSQLEPSQVEDMGFSSYLVKPVRPKDLGAAIISYGEKLG